jgi:hypothetical protein
VNRGIAFFSIQIVPAIINKQRIKNTKSLNYYTMAGTQPIVINCEKERDRSGSMELASQHLELGGRVADSANHILDTLHVESRLTGDQIGSVRHDTVKSVNDSERGIVRTVHATGDHLRQGLDQAHISIRDSVEKGNCTTERQSGEIKMELEKVAAHQRELTNRNLFELTKLELEQVGHLRDEMRGTRSALERQVSDTRADLLMEQLKSKCSIEQKIDQRADRTDGLIREIDRDRLRDELAQARLQALISGLSNGATIPPTFFARANANG